MQFHIIGVRLTLVPDSSGNRIFADGCHSGFKQVGGFVGMLLEGILFRTGNVLHPPLTYPSVDKIITVPVGEEIGHQRIPLHRSAVNPRFGGRPSDSVLYQSYRYI
jgi:hypothetical protein